MSFADNFVFSIIASICIAPPFLSNINLRISCCISLSAIILPFSLSGIARFSSCKISSAHVTHFAPSLIRLLGPADVSQYTLPGTANTSRFCSSAKFAVIRAPLLSLASITTIPSDRPDITRFL